MLFFLQERRIVTTPCEQQSGKVQRTVNIECTKSSCGVFPMQVFGDNGNTKLFTCYDDLKVCGEGTFIRFYSYANSKIKHFWTFIHKYYQTICSKCTIEIDEVVQIIL